MGYRAGSSGGGGGGSAATGETITAGTVADPATVISKNKTISNPTVPTAVYLALPSASAAVAYQDYEIKDGAGLADTSAPITITTESGSIDGVAEDLIDARWGSKTYYTDGLNWFVKSDTTKVLGVASGAGSYLANFGGSDAGALPSGWSSIANGSGQPDWLIQTDTFYSAANTSSAGAEWDPGTSNFPYNTGDSTLTYNAGTLASGSIITFKWIRDTYDGSGGAAVYGQTIGYYNVLRFKVNGLMEERHSVISTWQVVSYTIPSTGTYIFSWEWVRISRDTDGNTNNGCFIDEFNIS